MTEPRMTPFEARLEQRLRAYASIEPRAFDASVMAGDAMRGAVMPSWWPRLLPAARTGALVAALVALLVATAALVGSSIFERPPDAWRASGALTTARTDSTLVALPDGRILVVGGWTDDGPAAGGAGLFADARALADIEMWDPRTRAFTAAGRMIQARIGATATVLADGRVLIAGGTSDLPAMLHRGDRAALESGGSASAEIWDPGTGTSRPAVDMTTARAWHSATLLADGRVLIAGGATDAVAAEPGELPLASVEVFDPTTETFRPLDPGLDHARQAHAAVRLADGRVLLVGGRTIVNTCCMTTYEGVPSLELFDPVASSFSTIDTGTVAYRAAAPTDDGDWILVGFDLDPADGANASAWARFDPATGALTPIPAAGRIMAAAAPLADGRVIASARLTFGHLDEGGASALALYDPQGDTISPLDDPSGVVSGRALIGRPDGSALLVGGDEDEADAAASSLVFVPGRSLMDLLLP